MATFILGEDMNFEFRTLAYDANIGKYADVLASVECEYKKGNPVVIMATEASGGGALHGLVELEAFLDSGKQNFPVSLIRDIDRKDWESTDCPEVCEALRQVFYMKQQQVSFGTGGGKTIMIDGKELPAFKIK
jgi:hypothetical protein